MKPNSQGGTKKNVSRNESTARPDILSDAMKSPIQTLDKRSAIQTWKGGCGPPLTWMKADGPGTTTTRWKTPADQGDTTISMIDDPTATTSQRNDMNDIHVVTRSHLRIGAMEGHSVVQQTDGLFLPIAPWVIQDDPNQNGMSQDDTGQNGPSQNGITLRKNPRPSPSLG